MCNQQSATRRRLWLSLVACAGVAVAPAVLTAQALTQSLPLADVLARTRSSPQVSLQVRLQLTRAKLKREDIICTGQVLDSSWTKLGGTVLGPYQCPIGSRTMVLTAKSNFTDAAGVRVRRSEPDVKERAVASRENRFQVSWIKG